LLPRTANEPEELQFDAVQIEVQRLRGNVYVLSSTGGNVSAGNITVQFGPDGVLVVDTQYHQLALRNLEAIRALTSQPVKYVINTHMHVDHVSGNELFRWNGSPSRAFDAVSAAKVLAHEKVLQRLSKPISDGGRRGEVWPTDVYAGAEAQVAFNGEIVRLRHQPRAHTDGDTFVHFVGSDVVSAGDIYQNIRYPFIDRANGGSIDGLVEALDNLVDMVSTSGERAGETLVVPGHGAVATEADAVAYRDMIVGVRDRIQRMIDAGMSLRQIQAADPTADYDPRFRVYTGTWTVTQFVEAIYQDLASK
jgi:glyoxylase-like metal-dependent hydrolase (beta-lactamase superfamily II)